MTRLLLKQFFREIERCKKKNRERRSLTDYKKKSYLTLCLFIYPNQHYFEPICADYIHRDDNIIAINKNDK